MRLIDADSLEMEDFRHCMDCDSIIQVIKHLPVVDAEPVVHARWESCRKDWLRDDGKSVFQQCSKCHTPYVRNFLSDAKYCPNCGAKMDLEENE